MMWAGVCESGFRIQVSTQTEGNISFQVKQCWEFRAINFSHFLVGTSAVFKTFAPLVPARLDKQSLVDRWSLKNKLNCAPFISFPSEIFYYFGSLFIYFFLTLFQLVFK